MRIHEITTHRWRLRRLKKLFDRIYRELASCRSVSVLLKPRKPRPPASMDDNVGRSVLSARYPTVASTARHMPQRIVAKLKRARKPKPVQRATPAATGKPAAHSQQSAAKQAQAAASNPSQPTATTAKPTAMQPSANPAPQQPVSALPVNAAFGAQGATQALPKPVAVPTVTAATAAKSPAAALPRPPATIRAVQRIPRARPR